MTRANDFVLGEDGDMVIGDNGDFTVGFSDDQHIQHILLAFPGFYRNSLLTGVGITAYNKASGAELTLQRNIRIQLEADNYSINTVKVIDGNNFNVTVDADRIR